MRETFGRNFDVVIVVWAIALAFAWMCLVLLRADPFSTPYQYDPSALLRLVL